VDRAWVVNAAPLIALGRIDSLDLISALVGTLGILLRSKREGLVSEVRPLPERLAQAGYYLDRTLVESVLAKAGE
jgi:predicted nucleic acid-binding protein